MFLWLCTLIQYQIQEVSNKDSRSEAQSSSLQGSSSSCHAQCLQTSVPKGIMQAENLHPFKKDWSSTQQTNPKEIITDTSILGKYPQLTGAWEDVKVSHLLLLILLFPKDLHTITAGDTRAGTARPFRLRPSEEPRCVPVLGLGQGCCRARWDSVRLDELPRVAQAGTQWLKFTATQNQNWVLLWYWYQGRGAGTGTTHYCCQQALAVGTYWAVEPKMRSQCTLTAIPGDCRSYSELIHPAACVEGHDNARSNSKWKACLTPFTTSFALNCIFCDAPAGGAAQKLIPHI